MLETQSAQVLARWKMAESDRTVHYDDDDAQTTLLERNTSQLGRPDPDHRLDHSDPVRSVRLLGSINAIMNSSETGHHCYQRLSASVSSTTSSVVPLLHVYRRRWYILFIFTTFSFVQVQLFTLFVNFLSHYL